MKDFFDRVTIEKFEIKPVCDKCIYSLVSPGYEKLLDDMLCSVDLNGDVKDAKLFVFVVNPDTSCLQIIEKHNAVPIICHADKTSIDTKSVVYNIFDLIECDKYIYLDTDTLVLDSLQPVFDLLDTIPDESILMCLDQYFSWAKNIEEAYTGTLYNGCVDDFAYLLGSKNVEKEKKYDKIINAGIFACKAQGLNKLYNTILSFNNLIKWAESGFIREQFIVNLALAHDDNLVVLDYAYNWQLAIRTVLKYVKNGKDALDIHVGYNPFFLDHIPDPENFISKINDGNDNISVYLKSKIINDGHIYFLNEIRNLGYNRLQTIVVLEDILNALIIQSDLFDEEILSQFGYEYKQDMKYWDRVKINKQIVNHYYFGSKYNCEEINIENKISILHFNGQRKNANYARTFFKKQMLMNQPCAVSKPDNCGINIVISTHKKYSDTTLPPLLKSLIELNGIPKEKILIVAGGYDKSETTSICGVEKRCVSHNSFDHTGLIDILENNIYNNYWFLIQDTCTVGPDFYKNITMFNNMYDYVSVDGKGFLNMGLFSWAFLQSIKKYILSLKDCSKERAMLSEKMYIYLGNTSTFGDLTPEFAGFGDVYKTNTMRNICYYPSVDLYKYQANMSDDAAIICKP